MKPEPIEVEGLQLLGLQARDSENSGSCIGIGLTFCGFLEVFRSQGRRSSKAQCHISTSTAAGTELFAAQALLKTWPRRVPVYGHPKNAHPLEMTLGASLKAAREVANKTQAAGRSSCRAPDVPTCSISPLNSPTMISFRAHSCRQLVRSLT